MLPTSQSLAGSVRNIMTTRHDSPGFDSLSRRRFVSSALLAGTPFFVPTNTESQIPSPREQFLAMPKPADAVTDFLLLIGTIERYLLHRYYVIIGTIATELSDQYAELRKVVKQFLDLVPELKSDITTTNLNDVTNLGWASLLKINYLATSKASITEQMTLMNVSSRSLDDFADTSQQKQGSLVLSPEAVEKLKEIIRRINALNEPTQDLKDASDALGGGMSKIRDLTRPAEKHLAAAIRKLVQAELADFPPPGFQSPSTPSSAQAFRAEAIGEIEKAYDALAKLGSFEPPPKLQAYELKAKLTQKDKQRLSANEGVPPQSIIESLTGCIGWIREGNFFVDKSHSGVVQDPRFQSVGYVPSPPLFGYGTWQAIRSLLGSLIPEATSRRTGQLWWRKRCVRYYPAAKQQEIFYNFLLELDPPSDIDLSKDNNKRVDAAQRLADMQWV